MHEVRASLFKVLAHPHRIVMLNELRDGDKSVREVSDALDLPPGHVARHMTILSDYGLVCIRPGDSKRYCCLAAPEVVQHLEALAHELEEACHASGRNGSRRE